MEWEIGDIHFIVSGMCLHLFWGNGKIAKLFRKIRRLRGETPPPTIDDYWRNYRKEQIKLARVLCEEYNIGDGISTTNKEAKMKEQKKILGQIITLSKMKE